MKAAKLNQRPAFALMKQTDIQSVHHLQMPRWLFSDPRYAEMSLDAKVAYTFLLNRFQLSRRNGWVNDNGEVFVIFPRKALAQELRICEQRVSAAFRKLAELHLIWENAADGATPTRSISPAYSPWMIRITSARHLWSRRNAAQEPRILRLLILQNRRIGGSRTAKPAVQEPQMLRLQNRKICGQVILIRGRTMRVILKSVHPSRRDRTKKSLPAFWMPVSSPLLSRRWPTFLKRPSSGFFIRTAFG